jgi:tetratricopeptide (TPR) repeat protein
MSAPALTSCSSTTPTTRLIELLADPNPPKATLTEVVTATLALPDELTNVQRILRIAKALGAHRHYAEAARLLAGLNPTWKTPIDVLDLYIHTLMHCSAPRLQPAFDLVEDLLAHRPKSNPGLHWWIELSLTNGDWPEAYAVCCELASLYPKNPTTWAICGLACLKYQYGKKFTRLREANNWYTKLRQHRPSIATALAGLAGVAWARNNADQALSDASLALQHDPANVAAYLVIAKVQAQRRQHAELIATCLTGLQQPWVTEHDRLMFVRLLGYGFLEYYRRSGYSDDAASARTYLTIAATSGIRRSACDLVFLCCLQQRRAPVAGLRAEAKRFLAQAERTSPPNAIIVQEARQCFEEAFDR